MSTYDGAYTTKKYPHHQPQQPKVQERYRVLEATLVDSYHYHGSMFEYTWDLKLEDADGNITQQNLDTWRDYTPEQIVNKAIEHNGTTFTLI